MSALLTVDNLLRDRDAVLDRIDRGEALGSMVRALVPTIAVSAAVFGAALGLHRGGVQIAYAALKLPLVLLLTAAVCTPAFAAFSTVVLGRPDVRRDAATVLACLALGSLLMAATAPILVLLILLSASYHTVFLAAVGCGGLGGLAGLSIFLRALRRRPMEGRRFVTVALFSVFAMVGCQLSWTLRPYLLRPRTENVVFVRALEGSFLQAVAVSFDSARGLYHRAAAPLPR